MEEAVAEQAMYLQRVQDSEAAGEWNTEVGAGARLARTRLAPPLPGAARSMVVAQR